MSSPITGAIVSVFAGGAFCESVVPVVHGVSCLFLPFSGLSSTFPISRSFSRRARGVSRDLTHGELGALRQPLAFLYQHTHSRSVYHSTPWSACPLPYAVLPADSTGSQRTVGALLSGWTADKIGRKRTIQLGCLVATIGRFCLLVRQASDPLSALWVIRVLMRSTQDV